MEGPAASSHLEAPNNSVPPERVQDMRKAIHSYLQQSNTYGQIRDIIDTYAADNESFNAKDPTDVLKVLQERGLVQKILQRMQYQNAAISGRGAGALAASRSRSLLQGLRPNEKYLHVRLVGGRAFIDNLDADINAQRSSQMVVCMQYAGQRFRSTPQEATVDPCFDDDFLIHLDHVHSDLIDLATPLQVSVVKEECSLGRCRLVGENTIEWRKVLVTGFMSLTVELCGANPSVPTGVVELEIELIPGGGKVPAEMVADRVAGQRSAVIAADREFLIYARRWWNDYHSIRASHRQRHVKVFAATASGRMVPVTHYISVIGPDRSIESPAAAARFVSLFTLQNREDATADLLSGGASAGGGSAGSSAAGAVWASPFAFLSQKHGEACNHATLLCSLLLGFGLDAYCVVGTEGSDAASHMWVMTRRRVAGHDYEVLYWEPTTGERFAVNGAHQYQTVGCAFNHMSFYANTQDNDSAVTTYFNFDDEAHWSPLNALKLRMVPKFPNPSLLFIPMNTRLMETELEASLKRLIAERRDTLGLPTRWDESLAAVSAQALTGYEEQRTKGPDAATVDFGTFHACVKGVIGDGMTFKGFPINVGHIGETRIVSLLQAAAAGREVLQLNADDVRHAIRVRIFAFPEGLVSVWVMFAARYRPLP